MVLEKAAVDEKDIAVLSFKGEHMAISGIGIIHGLASNDELLLLLTLSLGLSSFYMMLVGLTIFTLGVVIGMMAFGVVIKMPFERFGKENVVKAVNVSISLLTLAYGIYSVSGGETLNLLPFVGEDLSGALLFIALLLGIKHSMDADHIVAISSILIRSPSLGNTLTLSVSWALGHMLTASVITFILYSFRELFLDKYLASFEIAVGIMLIAIALLTLAWEFNIIKFGKHVHSHEDGTIHSH